MAVPEVSAAQPLKSAQLVSGGREAQAPAQEVQKTRPQDQLELSRTSEERGKLDANKAGEALRTQELQDRAQVQARRENDQASTAPAVGPRLDIIA